MKRNQEFQVEKYFYCFKIVILLIISIEINENPKMNEFEHSSLEIFKIKKEFHMQYLN